MPYLDYSGGTSLEDLMMKKLGEGQYATAAPTISPELSAFGAQPGTAKPELTTGEKVMKGIQDLSPLMAQVGTSLMRGRNTVTGAPTETAGSQVGSALTSMLGTMKLNEAMKKMIAQQLGGGSSFTEGQPLGLSSAETVGLSPEQVSGLYGTGLGIREKELERPFKNMQALSESYLKIMTGEAKPAEIALHNATAQKTLEEIAAMPAKSWQEWQAKEAATKKITAEIDEIKAKTEAIPTETARKKAETVKTAAETKKLGLEIDPNFIAFKKRLETEYGPLHEMRLGDKVVLTNAATGARVGSFAIGAAPESAAKTKAEELPMKKFAMQRIAPLVVRQLEGEMAAMPGGKEKVDLQNLISSLRGYTGEIDPGVLLAKSSPELQDKFNKLMDIYVKTPGLSETEFGGIVQSILGAKGAPVVSEKPSGKPVTEKYKPGTAITAEQVTKQLAGKKPGTYESDNYTVEWDGKTAVIKPKSVKSATSPYNFGTFF